MCERAIAIGPYGVIRTIPIITKPRSRGWSEVETAVDVDRSGLLDDREPGAGEPGIDPHGVRAAGYSSR